MSKSCKLFGASAAEKNRDNPLPQRQEQRAVYILDPMGGSQKSEIKEEDQ